MPIDPGASGRMIEYWVVGAPHEVLLMSTECIVRSLVWATASGTPLLLCSATRLPSWLS
jgi:hypothetical protein